MIGRRDDAALAQLQRRDVGCLLIDTRAESGNGGCWIGLKEETERGGRRGTRGMTDLKQKKYIYVGMTFFFFFCNAFARSSGPVEEFDTAAICRKRESFMGVGGVFSGYLLNITCIRRLTHVSALKKQDGGRK